MHPIEFSSESERQESDSVEKSNSFVGTEEYVAPEILIGKGRDFAVDCWCLGFMLHEMLYGMMSFKGSLKIPENPKLIEAFGFQNNTA